MKRLIAMLLAALMLIGMPALADGEGGKQDGAQQSEQHMVPFADASARDTELMMLADELTMQMAALGSMQGYVKMMTLSDEIQGVVNEIVAHDYSAPKRSVVVFIDKLAVDTFGKLMMVASGMKFDANNKELPGMIFSRIIGGMSSSFLTTKGSEWLAGSSLIAMGTARVVNDVPAGIAYVVNDYGEGVPYSWTSFEVGEDGAASISSRYIPEDNEAIEQFFEARGAMSIPGMDLGMLPMSSVLYDRTEGKTE